MGLFANLFGKSKQENDISTLDFGPWDNWYVGKEPPVCKCGATARPEEFSEDFDRTWECPECGMRMWVNDGVVCYDTDDYNYDDVYGTVDKDEEPGCSACDNPNYPMCKDSCPMFD